MIVINQVNEYALHFSDYLKQNRGKFVGIISPNQYAMEVDKNLAHEGMVSDLIKKTRPNLQMDTWGNALDPDNDYRNDTIVVLGYPGYMQIELPLKQMLNSNQYKYLYDILKAVKKFNSEQMENADNKYEVLAFGFGVVEVEAKYYKDDLDDLINKLIPFVSDNNNCVIDEVIIGEEFNNSFVKNLAGDDILDEFKDDNVVDTENDIKLKGYSSIFALILVTAIVSAGIILLGVFLNIN